MQYFTIKLPTHTYLKKYICHRYGDTIIIDTETDFGFTMLCAFTSRLDGKIKRNLLDEQLNRYNDQVIFRIPIHYFSIANKFPSRYTMVMINRMIKRRFVEEMTAYVAERRSMGVFINKSINEFANRFGIDPDIDISFDALKKMEQRSKKNMEKFSRHLSHTSETLFQ